MSIGGFKAVKLRATTNKSTQSGVIIAYAANAKDTLLRVKDAIVGFGGWTWNNDLGFVSTTGYETDQYITYYTTLTHTNGAQLFISYGAAGIQFHWSCFCQGAYLGNYASYPTITEGGTSYTMTNGGGWRGGLCMSMIPPGSSNHYGTPNRTDNTWMPSDATPLCGYLGTIVEAYKNATTISTAARLTSASEYITIIAKDDLFVVVCHEATWAGFSSVTGMGQPAYYGYIVGKLFENLAEDDNQYYSAYGWLANARQARVTNNTYTDMYGFNGFYKTSVLEPENLFQMCYVPTGGSGQREFGGWGFFNKDGVKYNQYGPDGIAYCGPVTARDRTLDQRFYKLPDKAPWYALEVGWLLLSDAKINNNGLPTISENSFIKGTVRTDLVRAYQAVAADSYRFRLPPLGTKFENGNFIMGPSMCAWGWNSEYTDAETEELCPWRGQSGFSYNSSADFGGYQDIIQSIVSTGSKIFIAYTDYATKNTYVDSASLGGTTFDGANQACASAGWYSLSKLLWEGDLVLSTVNTAGVHCFYLINTSTRVATQVGNPFSGGTTAIYTGDNNCYTHAACWNSNLNHIATAWTGWDSTGGENIKVAIRILYTTSITNVFTSITTADSFTGLVQDMCVDNYNNIYVLYQDLGPWSNWSPVGTTYNFVVQKLVWDSANSTYKFEASDGTLSTDNTTMWIQDWGIPCSIVADKYGYIYIFYKSWENPTGNNDLGVRKMKPDGTLVWTKQIGVAGTDISQIRAIYTYDNKIHFSGQITGGAFPGFSQVNTTDTFFGTMTTDGMFAIKYQGGFTNGAVINTICCDDGYDYIGVNELNNISNIKPKYALLKRTW